MSIFNKVSESLKKSGENVEKMPKLEKSQGVAFWVILIIQHSCIKRGVTTKPWLLMLVAH